MSKLKGTAARKARRQSYQLENRYTKNKERKLLRHLGKHPEDKQAEKAVDNIKIYSRKKPYSKVPTFHTVVKKAASGKTFSVKEKTAAKRVQAKAIAYVDGIPIIKELEKTAMQVAMENAKH